MVLSVFGSKVLVTYIALGLVTALLAGRLAVAAANYLLLGVYVLIIHFATQRDSEPTTQLRSDRRWPLAMIGVVFAIYFGYLAWAWSAGSPLLGLLRSLHRQVLASGLDRQLSGALVNGVDSVIGLLLPAAIVTLGVFRLSPRAVGLAPRYLRLGGLLVVIGVALAGISKMIGSGSTPLFGDAPLIGLGLFGSAMFVNAIPEEFVFRGVIQSRAARIFSDARHAIVFSSILFVVSHVPVTLAQQPSVAWWEVAGSAVLSPGSQPTGLLWGYLFYRTGSIWPGALMHASFVTLGVVFL